MPTILTGKKGIAKDQSTFTITAQFLNDETPPSEFTPVSATWTLTNERGKIINEREDVEISPLAESVDIELSGDDLKYSDGVKRWLTIEATYNASSGVKPLVDSVQFVIANVVGV